MSSESGAPLTIGQKLKRARSLLPNQPGQHAVDMALGVTLGRTAKYEQGPGPRGVSLDYKLAWDRVYGEYVPWSYVEDPRDNFPSGIHVVEDETSKPVATPAPGEPEAELDRYGSKPVMLYLGDIPAGDYDDDPAFRPEYVEVEADVWRRGRYQMRVVGSSMEPALRYGDKVHFHPTRNARDGVIVHAQRGGQRTVKVARYRDSRWILEAFNKAHEMPLADWEIVGYLVTVKRAGNGGLEVRYHSELGLKPEMLPSD